MQMHFSSTDDDLRDAMAWRGVAWHAMAFIITIPRFKIAQNKHCLASPHLVTPH
jgi:hypothetical protein